MLKHSEVKPEFTSKHIQDASEKLRVMNLDEEQRKAYHHFMDNLSYQESMLWSSHEEGRQAERLETARRMLQEGLSIEMIVTCTGLTHEEIEPLQE